MDGTILFGENFKRQPTNGLIYACWSAVYLYFVSMRYSPEPVAVSLFNMRAASKFVMIILAEWRGSKEGRRLTRPQFMHTKITNIDLSWRWIFSVGG